MFTGGRKLKNGKFNKKKCEECKFHGYFGSKSGASNNYSVNHIMCDFAKYNKMTCLRRNGKSVIDLRGDDPENCKLYIKGKRPEDE